MKIAIGIVSVFVGGGLQRDCLEVEQLLRARGHDVRVFAARCSEDHPARARISLLPVQGLSNHQIDASFAAAFLKAAEHRFDLLVGFNKLRGLDLLYCVDRTVRHPAVAKWKRCLPRFRSRQLLEAACFAGSSSTVVLLLTEAAKSEYQEAWGTPDQRLQVLSPRVDKLRACSELRTSAARMVMRQRLGHDEGRLVWLWIGAQPDTKGLDRVLVALSRQPEARLVAVGPGTEGRKVRHYKRLARRLDVAERIEWLGHRDDVPELMAAADLLIHPARYDTTGQVILEAIAMGLPVVATAACGFAHHVTRAGAGVVLPEPFVPGDLDESLQRAQSAALRSVWSDGALRYFSANNFVRGLDDVADAIEATASRAARIRNS